MTPEAERQLRRQEEIQAQRRAAAAARGEPYRPPPPFGLMSAAQRRQQPWVVSYAPNEPAAAQRDRVRAESQRTASRRETVAYRPPPEQPTMSPQEMKAYVDRRRFPRVTTADMAVRVEQLRRAP